MKKIAALIPILSFVIMPLLAQDIKKETSEVKTKMETFSSKAGTIIKYIDFNLAAIKGAYLAVAETRIRRISNGTSAIYFYQIEKSGKYNSTVASIEYSDLLEVIKALKTLRNEVDADVSKKPDYLENKFETVDGFQIGYYVTKGKAAWYLRLDKHGSESTMFIDDVNSVDAALNVASAKIEELKK